MSDVIQQYRELLGAKKQYEMKLVHDEAVLTEKTTKRQEHLQTVLIKYNVNTLEELMALKAQKEEEATKIIEAIKADGAKKAEVV